MKLIDKRTIHFIPPRVLLEDALRVLRALKINYDVNEMGENSWKVTGKKGDIVIEISITSTFKPYRQMPGFSVGTSLALADQVPMTTIETRSSGDEVFNKMLMWRLELGLLRAGG